MIKGVTSKGFEFEIHDDALDDAELLDDLEEISNGKSLPTRSVLRRLIGVDGQKALYESLRDPKTKKVKASDVMEALSDIITTSSKLKNS